MEERESSAAESAAEAGRSGLGRSYRFIKSKMNSSLLFTQIETLHLNYHIFITTELFIIIILLFLNC